MLLLIGLFIGLILGLTGAGGSVFAVPLLLLLGGMSMADATGISLGAVAATTIYASLRNSVSRKQVPLLWEPGLILALSGALTAPLGKWLGMQLDELWLVSGFSLLAAIIALRMWMSARNNPQAASVVRAGNFAATPSPDHLCNLNPTGQFELRPRCVTGLLIGGLVVGLLSGLFGVGGGFLIVPLLLALSAVSMAQAVSTSLFIIALISSSGFISHVALSENQHWNWLLLVAAGGLVGMMIGQAVSHKIANVWLQKLFAIGLLAVALITLARYL
ncbi:sulfite exporter TauE/SafE family protein [Cellvibrio sp. pealriver]|uniref:sulfite exporter TauE/SafE family protein n=1 Tax=Cellvibrio sp. pealriver TaxID=1622269 RepID=UPI00066FB5A8|nr:sulfite exporter TauE/SafE family protein [Cellvibrio sp. pealriver]